MATGLDRQSYKSGLINLFKEMRTRSVNTTDDYLEQIDEEYAERFTKLTEDFVKSGRVETDVTTTGSSTAQTGTGIGNIT